MATTRKPKKSPTNAELMEEIDILRDRTFKDYNRLHNRLCDLERESIDREAWKDTASDFAFAVLGTFTVAFAILGVLHTAVAMIEHFS